MKYIRTKDGRIINTERITNNGLKLIHLIARDGTLRDGWYWDLKEFGIDLEIEDKDIIKQADTIPELCDEFVGISKIDKNDHYFLTRKAYKPSLEMEVYGAIWTNKGLIYVAKMNDKGELELL